MADAMIKGIKTKHGIAKIDYEAIEGAPDFSKVSLKGHTHTAEEVGAAAADHEHNVVTTAANGLVPMADAADGTIDSRTADWVLTNNNGAIGWYKLPSNAFSNTTYALATSTSSGLMSSTDKAKLDGIDSVTGTTTTTLSSLGITATATELNYVDGVTGNIQTQLNSKASTDHDHDGVYALEDHDHTTVPVHVHSLSAITISGSYGTSEPTSSTPGYIYFKISS